MDMRITIEKQEQAVHAGNSKIRDILSW